jgi:hypothetical protein
MTKTLRQGAIPHEIAWSRPRSELDIGAPGLMALS